MAVFKLAKDLAILGDSTRLQADRFVNEHVFLSFITRALCVKNWVKVH